MSDTEWEDTTYGDADEDGDQAQLEVDELEEEAAVAGDALEEAAAEQPKLYFASLPDFVDQFLTKAYRRHIPANAAWCTEWWKHGEAVCERELRGTAGYLHREQLVEAVHVEESSDGWIRPRLTVDGRECVTDHDGDVVAYLRDRRGGVGTTDNSTTVHISDNNGNLSINGERFTQNYNAGVDVAELLEFADGVRQMLPVLGLDTAAEGELAEAADQLHAEAGSPKPDHGRLRQLVKRLLDGLNQAAPTVAKTMLLAAGEAAQKAITGG